MSASTMRTERIQRRREVLAEKFARAEKIRESYRGGSVTIAELAEKYGLSPRTIWLMLQGRSNAPPGLRQLHVAVPAALARRLAQIAALRAVTVSEVACELLTRSAGEAAR